jgi:hypothetical protein
MATPTAYFDLLEDGLVEEVIRRMDQRKYPNRGWLDLAASSRRLCTLVGAGSWSSASAMFVVCPAA